MKAYHCKPLLEEAARDVSTPFGRYAAGMVDVPPAQPVMTLVRSAFTTLVPLAKMANYTTLKLCKNCSWHQGSTEWGFSKARHTCASPELLNLVTGEFSDCERNRQFQDKCGRSGKYFEIRQVPVITFNRKPIVTNDPREQPDDYVLNFLQ